MTGCTKPIAQRPLPARWGWLLVLLAVAQYQAQAQDATPAPPAVPDSVNNQLTARHVRVPGSTFYVRPAAGYGPEESLNGLAKPGGALLEVMRVPGANFLKVRQLIVQQYLAERGARVHTQRELTFNGYPAVFGAGESLEPGQNLMVLAFGDTATIALVFGLYPDQDAAAETELREMLLGGWYDPRGQVPPLELAPFVISLAGTPYRLQQVQPDEKRYVFGASPAAAADSFATRFTVQVLSPTAPAQARQHLQALAQAATTPGATLQSQERQLPATGGWNYEVRGTSTWRGRRYSFYQAIKTDEEATLILHGVAFQAPLATPAPRTGTTSKGKPVAKPPVAPPDPVAGFERVAATLRMKR
ncbi:hypothetical protein [Hymenobacter sp. CRA2]|uniref:hypothetical protein n=1 Tax=Hymenobacter sp. CRA2 TaxID=1955620 RepID=UPI00098F2584|nr:hypothetical protein [Hymenobacter sp. CRA2]OON69407.1 hypothetical protein B0919_09010 [Hymenobacter sp. CRA2]